MSTIPTEKEKKENLFDRDFSCQDIPLEQMRTTDGQLVSPLPKMVLCQEYKRDGVAGRTKASSKQEVFYRSDFTSVCLRTEKLICMGIHKLCDYWI
ncbi:hypothetical protein FRX31_012244 [Thalictrum thalictroides]|uniref:Uncharacterized protein n=1 Tax=Thalictrum thalictroides TaxID=46969 RepID=A0A7J6WLC0_THATH|nr:hypothetical protein FRX31_012244 [Thalictrum thalictroides]